MGDLEAGLFLFGDEALIGVATAGCLKNSQESLVLAAGEIGKSGARVYENSIISCVLTLTFNHIGAQSYFSYFLQTV